MHLPQLLEKGGEELQPAVLLTTASLAVKPTPNATVGGPTAHNVSNSALNVLVIRRS
jgi:hypothetical protein